ncbi:unnamed protein product [Heligmosomoides polygyrus]|uniref:DnaJ homolog subfamily C member 21 n=1 Tax=Heligmosomoides polygyrus TaxID=6339 RepID=A0A3P7ZLG9_HELPZ|nr:unnamed protein product [Heligmosomoides polygyrus]
MDRMALLVYARLSSFALLDFVIRSPVVMMAVPGTKNQPTTKTLHRSAFSPPLDDVGVADVADVATDVVGQSVAMSVTSSTRLWRRLNLAGVGLVAAGFGAWYLLRNQTVLKKGLEAIPGRVFDKYHRGGFESKMTRREEAVTLGLPATAKPNRTKEAHKRIMIAIHPDQGGSPYLSSKINEAKDSMESVEDLTYCLERFPRGHVAPAWKDRDGHLNGCAAMTLLPCSPIGVDLCNLLRPSRKGDVRDICNYRLICLFSVVYKLFTRFILYRASHAKKQDFGEISEIDHIHTVAKLIKVSRVYELPLCLTWHRLKMHLTP